MNPVYISQCLADLFENWTGTVTPTSEPDYYHQRHHILFPIQTFITNSEHNHAARKSQDQHSWLPIIATQLSNYILKLLNSSETLLLRDIDILLLLTHFAT